jgi:hypothetical protein
MHRAGKTNYAPARPMSVEERASQRPRLKTAFWSAAEIPRKSI